MLKYTLFLILLFSFSLVTSVPGRRVYRSYGGNIADIKDHPHTVAIYNELYEYLVGAGAILNNYWISLSALTIDKLVLPSIIVRAGSNDAASGGQRRTISKMITHEKYRNGYDYMIALIKLREPLEFNDYVGSIKMANETPVVDSEAVLTGYGDIFPTSQKLKAATVNILSSEKCPRHSDYTYCADAPGIGACYLKPLLNGTVASACEPLSSKKFWKVYQMNDRGGPLVQNGQLIGHFLGGDNCNMFGAPEVYSNVAAYQDWIINTIKKHSSEDEMEGLEGNGSEDGLE